MRPATPPAPGETAEGGRSPDRYPPIEEYGIIGNSRSCALVASDGSIDWLCLPRFDSPSVFGALLDRDRGGSFRVGPASGSADVDVSRRYLPDTNVLETTFATPGGRLRLTDLMPVTDERSKDRRAWADHQILRRVEALDGEVDVEVRFDPRPDYGRADPRVEDHGRLGVWCQNSAESLALLSDVPLEATPDGRCAVGRATLRPGDVRWLSLTYARGEPNVLLPLGEYAEDLLRTTVEWWEGWMEACRYDGRHPEAVRRSALALKLLTYAPSGAVIAAATTSLPETPGGERNWDYRFTWLRDATWTLRALFELGFDPEAGSFFGWMLHATRLTHPRLQPLYDVHGESDLEEEELGHLEGYGGARPVRTGNGAHDQLQLDVYGQVVTSAVEYVARGGEFDIEEASFLTGIGESVCELWREADRGIWEVRRGARHHTYSKVMCWTALDCLCRMAGEGLLDGVPVERFREQMEAIRRAVEERGWNDEKGCYVGAFDEDFVDASLLRLPLVGYEDASSERMRRTYRRVREELGDGVLLRRYGPDASDGLPGEEGAFGICSFWAVEVRALAGDVEGAEEDFERMLGFANDIGLFAEEIDPSTRRHLGNFPQAFTHVGLINAALTLQKCRSGSGDRTGGRPATPRKAIGR